MRYLNANVLLTLSVAAIGSCVSTDYCLGQSVAEEKVAIIDWEGAEADFKTGLSKAPGLAGFRERNNGTLAAIRLPVLMPSPSVLDATPTVGGKGNAYAIVYALSAAKFSVLGTSVFLTRPDDQALSQSGGSDKIFDHNDAGSDLSFLRYGASYTLRLSCDDPEDERCSKQDFLEKISNNLVVVGGRK